MGQNLIAIACWSAAVLLWAATALCVVSALGQAREAYEASRFSRALSHACLRAMGVWAIRAAIFAVVALALTGVAITR